MMLIVNPRRGDGPVRAWLCVTSSTSPTRSCAHSNPPQTKQRMRSRGSSVQCVWLLLLAMSVGAVIGAVCPKTGDPAPAMTTLMASKSNPVSDAWIVRPDCHVDIESVDVGEFGGLLTFKRENLERIDSVPSATKTASFASHTLSQGADFSKADKLKLIDVSSSSSLTLPSSLREISISGSLRTSIADIVLPAGLQRLVIMSTPINSLRGVNLPAALNQIYFEKNKLTAIDFVIPPKLTSLIIRSNPIAKLERIDFPNALEQIFFEDSSISSVRGVKWSSSLRSLFITGTTITNFEIRQSDLPTFKKLSADSFGAAVVQPTCADSTADVVVLVGKRLCVISDERFDAVYVNGNGVTPNAPATSKPSSSSSGTSTTGTGRTTRPKTSSGDGTADGSNVADANGSKAQDTNSPQDSVDLNGSVYDKNETEPNEASSFLQDQYEDEQGSSSRSALTPRSSRSSRSTAPAPNTINMTSSDSTPITPVVAAVCGSAVLVLLVVWLVRYCCSRDSKKKEDTDGVVETEYNSAQTPNRSSEIQSPTPAYNSYRSNDVRNDKALIPFRIEQSDIPLGQLVAKSQSSVVYKATFQGANVAVKQLVLGAWEFEDKMSRFMDEIRTCASLEHHKIVAFVGIAWSSLRDLSVIMEFMSLGDLSTLLYDQQDPPRTQDWLNTWTSSQIKSKVSIAQDVAEAVVYLHSFKNPILHRNLKARNVLLDEKGNAKLSGFGISRESTMDGTMTGEIGTAAWVAPEVLRGERYDDKADIFSLGVLLVELDRCEHPYASEAALQARGGAPPAAASAPGKRVVHHIAHKNTQIAVLVSSGKLRPSPSSECPERVSTVVARCLSFDPVDRPTSLEVYYGLRQARKAFEEELQ